MMQTDSGAPLAARGLSHSFPACAENVEGFIAGIHGFLAERNFGGLSFDMELLAREALVNAVQHGSGSNPGKTVHASLDLEDGSLVLTVRDEGPGWDWRSKLRVSPPVPASESGRGLFIIRKYSDGFSYNDLGNALTITKRVPSEDEEMNADAVVHLTLEARLAAQDVPALREVLRARIQDGARQIHLDFTQVKRLDSMGIGLLVATHNSLHKLGGSLYLSGVCKEVLQLLALMRLDKHFTITPVEEASHEA